MRISFKLLTALLVAWTGITSCGTETSDVQNEFDFSSPRILAHRGGRIEQEENTLAAFKATYEAGCHGFETDLHFDADHNLVVMHDFDLKRMTDSAGIIEHSSTEYIKSLRTKQGNPIPFVSDLTDYFSGCSTLYVEWEMKTNTEYYPDDVIPEYCDRVYSEVMPKKPADALYIFSSFDERPLLYMKDKYPDVEVMLITGDPCSHKVVDHCLSLGIHRCACWLNKTTREAVTYAHRKDVKVNLWPGAKEEDTALAYLLGADYLCTDMPVAVMSYLQEHKLPVCCEGVARHEKKLVCMDLDGTVTQHKTQLTPEAKATLDALGQKYHLLMVGGGSAERIHHQMGEYPIDILGNYGMQEARVIDGVWKLVREDCSPIDTAFFLNTCAGLREKYGYTEYYGDPLEFHQSGMVTFGLLGTAAPSEEKLKFDPDRKKRLEMYREVCKLFSDYSVFVGGTTSFDISLKKYNKYDAIMRFAEENGYSKDEIIFFGDDLGEGGNDSHVRFGGIECIRIDDYRNFPVLARPLLQD